MSNDFIEERILTGEVFWFEEFYTTRFKYLDILNDHGLDLDVTIDSEDDLKIASLDVYCAMFDNLLGFKQLLNKKKPTKPIKLNAMFGIINAQFDLYTVLDKNKIYDMRYFDSKLRKNLQELVIRAQNEARKELLKFAVPHNLVVGDNAFGVVFSDDEVGMIYAIVTLELIATLITQLDESILAIVKQNGFTERDQKTFQAEWV